MRASLDILRATSFERALQHRLAIAKASLAEIAQPYPIAEHEWAAFAVELHLLRASPGREAARGAWQ